MKKYTLSILLIIHMAGLLAQTTRGSIHSTANNDTITYSGSSGQVIPALAFTGDTIYNLVVDNTTGVVNNGALIIGSSYVLSNLAAATTPLAAPGKTVVITGSRLVINNFSGTPAAGQAFTLLSAGTLTGVFTSVILPAGVTGTVSYPSNTVVLTLDPAPGPAALFPDSSINARLRDESKTGPSFAVYPNPSRGLVVVMHGKAAAGSVLVVYSLDGKELLKKNVIAGDVQTTVDVSLLVSGVYMVTCKNDTSMKTKLFIKE